MSDNQDMPSSGQPVSLLIRNLSYNSSPDDIRSVFSEYGNIRDVYIPLDYHTRQPRGFGFVEFYEARDAERCIEMMDGKEMDGKVIEVTVAKKGRSDPTQMRRRENRDSGYRGGRDRRSPPRYRSDYRDRSRSRGRERRYRDRSPSPRYRSRHERRSRRSPSPRRSHSPRRSYSRSRSR